MKLITHIILAIAFCFVVVVSVSASQESDSLISTNVDYLKRNIERKIAKYEAKLEEYKNLLSELIQIYNINNYPSALYNVFWWCYIKIKSSILVFSSNKIHQYFEEKYFF